MLRIKLKYSLLLISLFSIYTSQLQSVGWKNFFGISIPSIAIGAVASSYVLYKKIENYAYYNVKSHIAKEFLKKDKEHAQQVDHLQNDYSAEIKHLQRENESLIRYINKLEQIINNRKIYSEKNGTAYTVRKIYKKDPGLSNLKVKTISNKTA